ncbi:MAG TPA: trypsin-like peptidase domain-containing protein [Acidobacteriaceae bacterium]|jgi:S1-C subfamily serine protease|nr:trypsin-like peptidase domain-containing protein [Acidobacteriaceae bacterium]
MRVRQLVLILFLLGAFVYLTSRGHLFGPPGTPLLSRIEGSVPAGLELTTADAQPAFTPQEQNNISVYKRVLPTVVNVTSTQLAYDFFYGIEPQQGQGSGFVLTKDGRILTNYHVVEGAQRVEVTLADKHRYSAQVVLQDPGHDIALLQINANNLTPAVLSESRDLQVGQNVYAIGNPFGLNGTMTTGIISSIRSVREPGGTLIENAIQTDAAINPGNSGGPLLNSRGEVIGMNTMIASNGAEQNSGIGFAIPVDTLRAILSDFQKYGRVRRPSLGIESLSIGPDLAEQIGLPADSGVLIQRVIPGGAAERAGLHGGNQRAYLGNTPIYLGGDLIVAIDSQQVSSTQDLSEIMDQHQAGDNVTVTLYRGRRQMTVKVTLGEAAQVST